MKKNSLNVFAICSLTLSVIPPSFTLSVPNWCVLEAGVLGIIHQEQARVVGCSPLKTFLVYKLRFGKIVVASLGYPLGMVG
jgi:hypothetical protein